MIAKTNDHRLMKKSHGTARQSNLSRKYDHLIKLESRKSLRKNQMKKRSNIKLRKSRQMNENLESSSLLSSNETKYNSTIEKLLNRESEIIVPLPLPLWEKPDNSNVSNNELISENNPVLKECLNETFMKDLGVSCLKKSMDMTPPENLDGRNSVSRHFSVTPMMMINKKMNPFKTPADNGKFLH